MFTITCLQNIQRRHGPHADGPRMASRTVVLMTNSPGGRGLFHSWSSAPLSLSLSRKESVDERKKIRSVRGSDPHHSLFLTDTISQGGPNSRIGRVGGKLDVCPLSYRGLRGHRLRHVITSRRVSTMSN